MGKANQAIPSRTYQVLLSQMSIPRALIVLGIFTVVIIAVLYWFFGTEIGASLRATGCNLSMSRAQGINTNVNKVLGLALSNGIVALAGALLAQYQGFADINMGRGAIVIGLAAVIIGEATVAKLGHSFVVRLLAVSVGGVIYYIVYQVIIFLGVDTDLLKMLSALVVAVFLGVPHLKGKIALKFPKRR
jgi:putative ABC transport system permease protein